MKNSLLLAFIGLAFIGQSLLPELTTAQTIPTSRAYRNPWYELPTYMYPEAGSTVTIYTERHLYELRLSNTFADVVTSGLIDTTYGDTLIYYGHLIETSQMSGYPHITITGIDSGKVAVDYRKVAYTGNLIATSPWQKWGDTITLTTTREVIKGAGGGRDTLVTPSEQPTMGDSNFVNFETGFIQFKYTFISTRAKKAGAYAKTHFVQPRAGINYTWRGEAVITSRRITR